MNRRKSLKLLATGAVAVPAIIAGCKNEDVEKKGGSTPTFNLDRNEDELEHEKKLLAMDRFFTDHELKTITVLADIIIPADEISGSASEAKVPEFIEFIVKDMPDHQLPMRGGLKWLDMQCLKRYNKTFVDCSQQQKMEMADDIAYPELEWTDEKGNKKKKGKTKLGMEQGVAFFSLMRNLTATGFYTSEIGLKDIGYAGNAANQWNGVPDEVLKQYGLAYSEKELKECVKF
mgnify:CR=1 FL=1